MPPVGDVLLVLLVAAAWLLGRPPARRPPPRSAEAVSPGPGTIADRTGSAARAGPGGPGGAAGRDGPDGRGASPTLTADTRPVTGTGRRSLTGPGTAPEVVVDPVTVVELLAVAVEAGATVPHALTSVGELVGGPAGPDLRRAGAALLLGAPWPDAWEHAPVRAEPLAPLGAAWTSGAPAGPALRAAAAALRRDRGRATREAAGRLGVRLVLPLGLCFLPAFVLVGLVPVLVSLASALLD